MNAVFDANVVVAAVCWDGEGYLCFVKLARRQAFGFGTAETMRETLEVVTRQVAITRPPHNASGRLNWYLERVKIVSPAPLGKQRSRDPKDDPYLAAALAADAELIVTYDNDLLSLGKPFGIKIVRPAAFLKLIKG